MATRRFLTGGLARGIIVGIVPGRLEVAGLQAQIEDLEQAPCKSSRAQAIGRVAVALKAFAVQGVKTNIPLLSGILSDEAFLAGQVDTGYLARYLARNQSGH